MTSPDSSDRQMKIGKQGVYNSNLFVFDRDSPMLVI